MTFCRLPIAQGSVVINHFQFRNWFQSCWCYKRRMQVYGIMRMILRYLYQSVRCQDWRWTRWSRL